MVVQIINSSRHSLPQYKSAEAAGMDVCAMLDQPITLLPMQRLLIPTGLQIAMPAGVEAQIRPRSGLALHQGLTVLNSPGTIDSDYRGQILILLINLSGEQQTIQDGDRIAQMVFAKHETVQWQIANTLQTTQRGEGGYGSTGISTS